MLVEALVLGGEGRVLELRRNIANRNHRAALFSELADQGAFRRVDAQRDFWLVIRQYIERREAGKRQQYGERYEDRANDYQPANQAQQIKQKTQPLQGRCTSAGGWSGRSCAAREIGRIIVLPRVQNISLDSFGSCC